MKYLLMMLAFSIKLNTRAQRFVLRRFNWTTWTEQSDRPLVVGRYWERVYGGQMAPSPLDGLDNYIHQFYMSTRWLWNAKQFALEFELDDDGYHVAFKVAIPWLFSIYFLISWDRSIWLTRRACGRDLYAIWGIRADASHLVINYWHNQNQPYQSFGWSWHFNWVQLLGKKHTNLDRTELGTFWLKQPAEGRYPESDHSFKMASIVVTHHYTLWPFGRSSHIWDMEVTDPPRFDRGDDFVKSMYKHCDLSFYDMVQHYIETVTNYRKQQG